jgi:hypothetical protein
MNQVANTVILPVEEYEALRAQVAALTYIWEEYIAQEKATSPGDSFL